MALTRIAFLLLLAGWSAAALADAPRPNFVMIVADDMGWADIGYHGSDVATPALDKLASTGLRLEQNYVYPTCSPTRVALLTGRNPSRYNVLGPIGGKSTKHLPFDTVTLPRALQSVGYSTHISGKWHLGLSTQYGPKKYGFDTTYGYLHGQIDPYNHLYKFGDRTWHRNDVLLDEEGHATDLITDEAVRVIRAKHDRPYFLYVAYSVPHHPLKEPDRWTRAYDGKIDDPWRKVFAASITHMDEGIGRIVAALDETNQRDDTLVVFTSDNGGQDNWPAPKSQYDGRYQPHTTLGNNRPLRGWKGQLYEGGVRVPAVANWPGKLSAGRKVNAPLFAADWFSTFAALAGYQVKPLLKLDGENVWPLLTGQEKAAPRSFYWRVGGGYALRHGDWKLITDRSGKRSQLFNLADDPYEKDDLAAKQPQHVERLSKQLAAQKALD